MKILQTISSLSAKSGGPSTCTLDLLNGLYDINAEVDLLTVSTEDILGKGSLWLQEVPNDCKTPLKFSKNIKRELKKSGPESESVSTVWEVATELVNNFGCGELKDSSDPNAVHEAKLLMLDISKAKNRLDWKPRLDMKQCVALVADWYKRYKTEDVYKLCVEEINKFIG